jgi:hypothetical protein
VLVDLFHHFRIISAHFLCFEHFLLIEDFFGLDFSEFRMVQVGFLKVENQLGLDIRAILAG